MDFNYYSFYLRGEERIYYAYIALHTEGEILDWAVNFNFIKEEDVNECTNVRALKPEEVEKRNRELYKQWWEEHKNDSYLSGKIPPTIGEVLLD